MSRHLRQGLHSREASAYNVHMRFNGVDSDEVLDNEECESCGNVTVVVHAVAYTRSYGDDVEWCCGGCLHINTRERHYL